MRQRAGLAKITSTLLSLALFFTLMAGPTAAQESAPGGPRVDARAWALTDAESGLYLAGKNPDERLPIASTTKIMVALVALEEGVDLDKEVTVSRDAEKYVGFTYSNVGLIAGERVTVRDLLVATLVPSGTDAVYALAEHLGDGSVERFVEKMNRKAESMGLENTHFENPAGLDVRGNYSSARDLAEIAREAMEYPVFADIVDNQEATISTNSREIEVFTTNNLLYAYDVTTGIKTGTSPAAGPCLVASAGDGDESYVAVVLDAKEDQYRFQAAQTVLDYGFDNYDRRPLIQEGEVYGELPLPFRPEESVGLAAEEDVLGLAGSGLEAERRVTEKDPPPAARAGQKLGTVELLVNGESAGSSPLVAQRSYEEASLWQKTKYWTGSTVKKVSGWFTG